MENEADEIIRDIEAWLTAAEPDQDADECRIAASVLRRKAAGFRTYCAIERNAGHRKRSLATAADWERIADMLDYMADKPWRNW